MENAGQPLESDRLDAVIIAEVFTGSGERPRVQFTAEVFPMIGAKTWKVPIPQIVCRAISAGMEDAREH